MIYEERTEINTSFDCRESTTETRSMLIPLLFLHFKNYFSITEIEIHFRSTVQGDLEHDLFHVQGEAERTNFLKIIVI